MKTSTKWIVYTSLGVGGLVCLRVSLKVWRLLSHREEVYYWLPSVIPPSGYDYKQDTPKTKEVVSQRHPTLTDIVENDTLTVLTKPPDCDGGMPDELYILGTAHVSKRTAAAVYRTICEVEPDAVVVELCKSRAFMMYRDITPEQYQYDDSAKSTPQLPATPNDQLSKDSSTGDVAGTTGVTQNGDAQVNTKQKSQQQQKSGSKGGTMESLSGLFSAISSGASPLQALLSYAYQKIETQLETVAGLEFIRARHAVQEVEEKWHKRIQEQNSNAALAARSTSSGGENATSHVDSHPVAGESPNSNSSSEGGGNDNSTDPTDNASSLLSTQTTDLLDQAMNTASPAVQSHAVHQQYSTGSMQDVALTPAQSGDDAQAAGIHVYLGDVPVQRTVSRMWGVLNVWQKLKLLWMLLSDILFLQADDDMLEQLLNQDVFQLIQTELGSTFPEILGPLLHERNWHLAYTVQQAAQHGMKKVVLIVGKGHVPGVVYCLLHPYRFRRARRSGSLSSQVSSGSLAQLPSGSM